jgi:putative tryptophan/tyrosine transport system substrate-binding protein
MYGFREFAQAGGLITYGAPLADGFRFRASDRQGPEGGSAFRRAGRAANPLSNGINLKTAERLRLDVPASLLAQADEVIE